MSEAEQQLWFQLWRRFDSTDERLDALTRELQECKATVSKVSGLDSKLEEVKAMQAGSQKWHEEHEADHGLRDRPPRLTVANLLGYGLHHPGRVAWLMLAGIGTPTVLALALVLLVGPGGGLRVLLQQAGIRAVYVPTPDPTRAP